MTSYETLLGLSNITADILNVNNFNAVTATIDSITDTGLTPITPLFSDANKKLISGTVTTTNSNLTVATSLANILIGLSNTPAVTTLTATTISTANLTSTTGLISAGLYTVNNTMTTAQIQAVISNTAYGVIEFQKGSYTLTTYLNVNRSDLVINGNGSSLNLGNNVNQPNLFIGDISTNPPTITYSNITINNLVLFGNRSNQTQEFSITKSWIANNCVGINLCWYVTLKNCTMNSARSGGFTSTYNSKYILVENCYCSNNYFDGLTAYGSESVKFANNTCINQSNGAGISIDTNNLYFIITGNTLTNNNLGIFARDTIDLTLSGNTISANSTHGLFLSGYNAIVDLGCLRWVITGNTISNNGGSGLFMQSCSDFTVTGNVFNHNATGISCTTYTMPDSPRGVGLRNSICGNVISGNTSVGFYNSADNSYANGARDNYLSLNVIKNNTTNISADLSAWTQDDDTILNTTQLTLHNGSGNYANVTASATGNCTFILPASTGSANSLLTTNGSGLSSFTLTPSITSITLNNGGFSAAISASSTGSTTLVLPPTSGAASNILQTNGSGASSWTDSPSLAHLTLTNGGFITGVIASGAGNCTLALPPSSGNTNDILTTNGSSLSSWTNTPTLTSVALKNGSFTATLSANASSSATFVFPPNNGTNGYVLATDGSGNTSWANKVSPALVQSKKNTTYTTATNAWEATGLSATITPSATSSKIMVNVCGNIYAVPGELCYCTVFNTTTAVDLATSGIGFASVTNGNTEPCSIVVYDSPASVSAQQYDVYIKSVGGAVCQWNSRTVTTTIVVQEIF